MSDTPPSCFIYINKLKERINGITDEYLDESEIDQAVIQLRTFMHSLKLDEKQTKKVEEIINWVQIAAHKLLVNMIFMSFSFFPFFSLQDDMTDIQSDIKNIKKDGNEVRKQFDDLQNNNNYLQNQLDNMKNEISKLK